MHQPLRVTTTTAELRIEITTTEYAFLLRTRSVSAKRQATNALAIAFPKQRVTWRSAHNNPAIHLTSMPRDDNPSVTVQILLSHLWDDQHIKGTEQHAERRKERAGRA